MREGEFQLHDSSSLFNVLTIGNEAFSLPKEICISTQRQAFRNAKGFLFVTRCEQTDSGSRLLPDSDTFGRRCRWIPLYRLILVELVSS